jgi:hypothetical protein
MFSEMAFLRMHNPEGPLIQIITNPKPKSNPYGNVQKLF